MVKNDNSRMLSKIMLALQGLLSLQAMVVLLPTQPRVETFWRCRKHCRSRALRCAMLLRDSGRVEIARHGAHIPPPRRRHAAQYSRSHSEHARLRRNTLNCTPQLSHGILPPPPQMLPHTPDIIYRYHALLPHSASNYHVMHSLLAKYLHKYTISLTFLLYCTPFDSNVF